MLEFKQNFPQECRQDCIYIFIFKLRKGNAYVCFLYFFFFILANILFYFFWETCLLHTWYLSCVIKWGFRLLLMDSLVPDLSFYVVATRWQISNRCLGFIFGLIAVKCPQIFWKAFVVLRWWWLGRSSSIEGERERTLSVKMEEMNKNNVLWGKMGKGIRNIKKILLSSGGKAHEKRWVK